MADAVNQPAHYTSHPSGVECITITQHMGFCLGNVVKYVWRADLKGEALEDLLKARTYLNYEIAKREAEAPISNLPCPACGFMWCDQWRERGVECRGAS